MQELDSDTVMRSKVFIDTQEAKEAGDLYIPIVQEKLVKEQDIIVGLIGAALQNKEQCWRKEDTDITIFKSVGTAVQDVATGYAVLHAAHERGLGTHVSLQ